MIQKEVGHKPIILLLILMTSVHNRHVKYNSSDNIMAEIKIRNCTKSMLSLLQPLTYEYCHSLNLQWH